MTCAPNIQAQMRDPAGARCRALAEVNTNVQRFSVRIGGGGCSASKCRLGSGQSAHNEKRSERGVGWGQNDGGEAR